MSASKKKKKSKKNIKNKKNTNNVTQKNVKKEIEKKAIKKELEEATKQNLIEENKNQKEINNIEKQEAKIEKQQEDVKEEIKETSEKNQNAIEKKEETETKKEIKKEAREDQKQLIKKENPEDEKDEIKNKKRKLIIFICIILIIIVLTGMSTSFALFNINNTNMITGVMIKNIDLSGLSIEDSKTRLQNNLDAELFEELKLKYNEYEVSLSPSQIEFKYDIDKALKEAYSIGRSGNILENNYEILIASFFGKKQEIEYSYSEDFLNEFVDDISSKIPGVIENPSYYIEDTNLIINQGKDGILVRKEELKEMILNSILERSFDDINSDDYNMPLEIPVEETKADKIDIEKIYLDVRRDPQDAYFELEPYQIFPDLDGIDFDLEVAKEIIKEYKDEYSIPLIITKASKTIKDLGLEAFPNLLSKFSTSYVASNVNRSTNLAIATNKINGIVLLPGEVFSFNKVVGKRTVEEGYKDAQIYADGGVVDGLAGGICQISSTLYNAVLLANLEIVERRNHSYTTSYLPAGKDATVVYGSIDFQFRNSRNYPIKIEAGVNGGIAEFKIHGMREETEYDIKIIPVTTASIPYTTQYVQDSNLAPGQQRVVQAGHAGYKVTTYIEKSLNGEVISKEVISNDTYSPMRSIINVGPDVPIQ